MLGEIVKPYLVRFPELPTRSLADKIYADHPELFRDAEHVRDQIRYLRGKKGSGAKKRIADKSFVEQKPVYRYNIPDADQCDVSPYILPVAASNILVMSDIHIPYHDPRAIELALDWGVAHGINTIVLNGDIVDFYQLSKFTKDPTFRRPKDELMLVRDFMKGITTALPNVKVYYKMGNHEERYENYLKVKAPELFDIADFKLDTILHLAEYGVEYVGGKKMILAGNLPILHGHEFNGVSASVNPARGLYLKTKSSAVIGHLHTSSEHNETNLDNELSTTWSVGCLCNLHPEYAPYNKWNHGFLQIKVAPDKSYKVFNARIYKGSVL